QGLVVSGERVQEIIDALQGLGLDAAGRPARLDMVNALNAVLVAQPGLAEGDNLATQLLYRALAPVNDLLGGAPLETVTPDGSPATLNNVASRATPRHGAR